VKVQTSGLAAIGRRCHEHFHTAEFQVYAAFDSPASAVVRQGLAGWEIERANEVEPMIRVILAACAMMGVAAPPRAEVFRPSASGDVRHQARKSEAA
jgi:hypothetical protein